MKEYDVMVIGAGSGLSLAYKALSEGMKVALVARENLGGTCMNVGCVPSKTLLYVADVVMEIGHAVELGIKAEVSSVDFPAIMKRMRETRQRGVDYIRNDLAETENIDLYEAEGHFIDEYTLDVGGEIIKAPKIFIASGARPAVPPIKGLGDIPYLTNESLLLLENQPKSIIIVGGSYIGVEYAHFFSGIGTDVSLVEYNDRLISFEEPEIADLLKVSMQKRMAIHSGYEALAAARSGTETALTIKSRKNAQEITVKGEQILIATGRKSNADHLQVAKTGLRLTPGGFIDVDDSLQTSMPRIWAMGDATGKGMFTHAADHEASIAWYNATHNEVRQMDFAAVPHAVFTVPQIASIGLTEEKAVLEHRILVGRAGYADIVQGDVRLEQKGFAKAIVEKETDRILGFHIIGPEASTLIQEVINVVARKGSYKTITGAMHIFPGLSELIPETFNHLKERDGS